MKLLISAYAEQTLIKLQNLGAVSNRAKDTGCLLKLAKPSRFLHLQRLEMHL